MARLTRFEWACLGIVAAAFTLRAWFVFHPYVIWDTAWYLMLARSFGERGDFWIRWTDPPEYSGYWPPLFPILASPVVKLLGPTYSAITLAACIVSAILTLVVFLTTRDLFGRTRAFAAMAFVAACPAIMSSDESGMAESALALAVTLTLWAFFKSLERPLWLVPTAFFALMAYFGKPNLGLPFVVAGLLPLAAWRIYWRGWRRVLRDPVDLGVGALAVVGLVALGVTRTGKLGGIGVGIIEPVQRALDFPLWAPFIVFKLLFAAIFLFVTVLPFSLFVGRELRKPTSERTGYLWILTILVLMATALFTTSFLITEKRGPLDYQNVVNAFGVGFGRGMVELTATIALLVDFDNIRYLTPAIVPFMWLVLPHFPIEEGQTSGSPTEGAEVRRRHTVLFGLAVGSYFVLLLLNPLVGVRSLGRLFAFLLLALIPLAFANAARNASYQVSTRKTRGEVGFRYVRGGRSEIRWKLVLWGGALALFTAYLFSAWFLFVAIALLVALATPSPRARVASMTLLILVSAFPPYVTPAPAEEVAAALGARFPSGALIGTYEPAVYIAAVAPGDLRLRAIPLDGVNDTRWDALVMPKFASGYEFPGYTRVEVWNYSFQFFPSVWVRLIIEKQLLRRSFEVPDDPAFALYVRSS